MELVIKGLQKQPVPTSLIPRGGTELMRDRVLAIIPQALQDKVQLCLSQPPETFDDKPRILWLHDLPNQPGPHRALEGEKHKNYNAIVFVSHWQREQFSYVYPNLPLEKCLVIKNGIESFITPEKTLEQLCVSKVTPAGTADNPFKLVYSSTPHRGLELVPSVVEGLVNAGFKHFEFHVFSSFQLYGQPQNDIKFAPLFAKLKAHPHVRYHGTVSNADLRAFLETAHMFVYPSIYQETSCLAMIEAMATGCAAVVPSLAALPETAGEWAFMYPWVPHGSHLVQHTIDFITKIGAAWASPTMQQRLVLQAAYFNQFYQMRTRTMPWISLFEEVANDTIPPVVI